MSLKDALKKAKQLDKAAARRQQAGNASDFHNNSLSNSTVVNIGASRQAIKPRNYLALNPLLQKGGIHDKEDVDIARKQRRRDTKQKLKQTDWLSDIQSSIDA